jgi:hypothetical protein
MNLRRSLSRSFVVPLLCTLAVFPLAPMSRAAIPESQLKLAGAIPLTTELLEKMEKFLTAEKSDAAAKAELDAVSHENKDNPPMTGEAWGSLITARCPKTVAVFKASDLTPEEFGKAAHVIETIIMAEVMAPPGNPDNLAKSQDKTVAANDAFYLANKARCDLVYGNFGIFGLQ